MTISNIKTIPMTTPLAKLVSQGFDRYNNILLIDNITLLPISYREEKDIVLLRVMKNIDKVFHIDIRNEEK